MTEWKLVPVEPTEEMISAAQRDLDTPFFGDLEIAYETMIAHTSDPTQDDAIALEIARALTEEANRNGRWSSRLTQARAVLAVLKGDA